MTAKQAMKLTAVPGMAGASIPDDLVRGVDVGGQTFRPSMMAHFPWVPLGQTIVVYEYLDGAMQLSSGLYAVTGVAGGQKRRQGLVVAIGAGDFEPMIGFVSPAKHLGIQVGDTVTWNPESGISWTIDGVPYLQLMPSDIRARMKDAAGLTARREAMAALVKSLGVHEDLGQEAGDATVEDVTSAQTNIGSEDRIGEAAERVMTRRGHRTKTQVTVPSKE